MRKFIVHPKPLPGYPTSFAPSVIEVECQLITAMEDPSVMWLPVGEFKARILGPQFLLDQEAKAGGVIEYTCPIYCSHALFWTINQARAAAERMIRSEFERAQRKQGISFTEEEVRDKFAQIKEIML
jgi:hypothetical protein